MYLHSINGFYFPCIPIVTASASDAHPQQPRISVSLKGKERESRSDNQDNPASANMQEWIYSNVPALQHSTQLEMPIHYVVAGVTPERDPKSKTEHKYCPGDWVQIKSGYNKGDLALVSAPDLWMDYDSTQPPPSPLFFDEAVALGQEMNLEAIMLNCYHTECFKKYPCGHLQGFLYNDMLLCGRLVALQERPQCLSAAPPLTIDLDIFECFACSQHPAVCGSWLQMPIPLTWSFSKGEEVHIFEPFGCEYTGPLLPKSCHGTIGTLQTVQPMSCRVAFSLKVFSLTTILLQRNFGNMDIVFIPSIDGLSLVMACDPLWCSVSVLLNDGTVQQLKQQAREESVTRLLNNEHFSSTVVKPVQSFALNSVYKAPSLTNISDISSSIAAMIQLVSSQNLPSPKSSQEFHTRQVPQIGYIPEYTNVQAAAIDIHNIKQHANILYKKVVAADVREYKTQLRSLVLMDYLLPNKWILNPIWHLSLHDLELYIQIHHGPYASKNDQLVHLVLSGGRLQDICDIPVGGVHTKKVSSKVYNARGLYLVADANDVKLHHHVGKLVCRISNMTHNDNGNVLCGDSLYFVQRVNLYPIPGKVSYEEEVMVNERPFAIDYSFLLLVHLSAALKAAGNRKMYNIRTEFKGWMLPAEEPNGQENSYIAKWKKAEITVSMYGLAEWIERAQTGRGQTPPSPLPPGLIDWESVSLI
ncbi:hypothetical protein GYMLUDRAFT_248307 [Collybiopsis luxurians FD-317 M1]|uniref:Uncharacterized protein n=1 Tax=Collybiopsis luxurians FD-317 M1 TaxID=944289 RepID=A0A0D0AYV2_9AGAR|nr:hypothetical protein GYMLUDRAFT_248307 [Collybiopsis luxurians FD-317 M1]